MMGLLDEIRSEYRRSGTKGCAVHRVAAAMSEDDAAELFVALADGSISVSQIERALRGRDISVSYATLQRFRNQGCRCVAS